MGRVGSQRTSWPSASNPLTTVVVATECAPACVGAHGPGGCPCGSDLGLGAWRFQTCSVEAEGGRHANRPPSREQFHGSDSPFPKDGLLPYFSDEWFKEEKHSCRSKSKITKAVQPDSPRASEPLHTLPTPPFLGEAGVSHLKD